MRGFSNEFRDFPDYILTITEQIWEQRGLASRMRDYYHQDVIVRMPGGISTGERASTNATMATLTEFPDRQLMGEDVIWSGDPEQGMLSSHRILNTATHEGGPFGPASGRKLVYRAIADCYAKDNQISDEWLIRDNGGVVRQLGVTPEDWVKAEMEAGRTPGVFLPENDVEGPYLGRGNDNLWGQTYADLLSTVMDGRLSIIPEGYDRAVNLELPGGQSGYGHQAADAFWLGVKSAFPNAEFKVHHQIGNEDDLLSPRAALRWSLDGLHEGWGAFGRPTGKRVHIMGISHAEFGPRGLRREWVLFDELAIWTQLLM